MSRKFIRVALIALAIFGSVLLIKAEVSEQDKDLITTKVTFDIEIDGQYLGQIKLGLFGMYNPKTARNFATFADKGHQGKKYVGSSFHRVIKDFMIQGGDIINGDGTGSISIYGRKFNDEFPSHAHTVPGLLSMANSGPNTNGCQFFITTKPTPWLDRKHVVFGKVLDKESMDIVHKIENSPVDGNSKPLKPVKIVNSVVEKLDKPFHSPLVAL